MPTTISSRDLNQDIGAAKRAARQGPVIITDRGVPAFVLLTHDEYCRLLGADGRTMVDMLAQQGGEDIDFEPPRLGEHGLFRPMTLD